jgi:ATP-dependent DNA helicase DinG
MTVAEEVFGGDGILAYNFENYTPRQSQYKLVEAIEEALDAATNLIGEAPVGTGKSLAYLAPAIMKANLEKSIDMIDRIATGEGAEEGDKFKAVGKQGRIIVVTGNIALQEQLINKDLPLLKKILPRNFSFALAKGMGNYVCKNKAQLTERDNAWRKKFSQLEVAQVEDMLAWSQKTNTGDKSELDFEPSGRAWTLMSTTSDECQGSDCEFMKAKSCYPKAAKDAYADANVIVCNYALFLLHLKLVSETGKHLILPEASTIILDEAHLLPKIARDHLGFDISYFTFMKLAQTVSFAAGFVSHHLTGDCHGASNELQQAAKELMKDLTIYKRKNPNLPRITAKKSVSIERVTTALADTKALLANAIIQLDGNAAKFKILDPEDMKASGNDRNKLRFGQAAKRCDEIIRQLNELKDMSNDNMCMYVEEPPSEGFDHESKLCGRMVDVSGFLKTHLFKPGQSVIMVSGTLSVAGTFHHFIEETGVEKPHQVIVDSPFNYDKNAALVIPADLHEPNEMGAADLNGQIIRDVVMKAKGRTLALFTSYKGLKAAEKALKGVPYRVLVQGSAPRSVLVKQFKEDTSSVLLGTESFWAGIDLPGETCSCVVIDKLPFPHFLDPMADAIKAKFGESFKRYQMPHAITQFRQGFGRLIRTETDRGVCVILDNRLRSKGYGSAFIRSLPKMMIGSEISDVGDFLNN